MRTLLELDVIVDVVVEVLVVVELVVELALGAYGEVMASVPLLGAPFGGRLFGIPKIGS